MRLFFLKFAFFFFLNKVSRCAVLSSLFQACGCGCLIDLVHLLYRARARDRDLSWGVGVLFNLQPTHVGEDI